MNDSDDALSFDAAALFAHLNELGNDPSESYLWSFAFSNDSVDQLETAITPIGEFVCEEMSLEPDDIEFLLADDTKIIDHDGNERDGPPMLILEFNAALSESQLSSLHAGFQARSTQNAIQYEGVSNCEPPDGDDWEQLN